MAQLTPSAFKSKWDSRFADNITGQINEGDLREFAHDIADSFEPLANAPAPVTPAAPTAGIVNDTDNTFDFTLAQY